ncbi:MAG: ATP-dependent RecD-like DNA helicase [Candidatus Aminicenantes bacterium]|nr:ATP-dependent RecD-like DNA helicase [Candidatus Aminicenantes bacterium]
MDYLQGTIENVVYYSPESGYTVCKFAGEDGMVFTIVGTFPPLSPGETIKIKGKWVISPKFGKQFSVDNYIPLLPSSVKGIEKFLSSGLIKGIGPVLAKRIVTRFGPQTIDILTNNIDKLKQVDGVGAVKFNEIKKSWSMNEDIRELIIFLQEHNISTGLATKIYRQYGKNSYHILKTNPYQACHDIWGVGFKTADQIALNLGMSPTSPERIKAFILYALEKDNEQGHVFSFQKNLIKTCQKEIEAEEGKILDGLKDLKSEKLVRSERVGDDSAIFLPFYYIAQEDVVKDIYALAHFPFIRPEFDVEKEISSTEKGLQIQFSPVQRLAIKESVNKKILVITGGPGTGKTTIIKAVFDLFNKDGRTVLLAAPTGRAAKRLSEATRHEARTLHRTLEFTPKIGTFRRNATHPLQGDALIIDEFSMVDLPLMYHLLKAIPREMHLILVGDKDQLPSVGPGNLLRDIIESETVEVVRLDEIFRQEKESLIVYNAHRVNQGEKIVHPEKGDTESDFYFINQEDDQKAFQTIISLCSDRIPQKLNLHPLSQEIQVISPMYRGVVGIENLNLELQKRLNPGQEGLKLGSREIRIYDKVMQIKNNYDKIVFNGDIGAVVDVDKRAFSVTVNYEGRDVLYQREELNEIVLAYAVSVHKSQGSEYSAVVMPLMTQHFIMLQRNLFYTALTRARRLSCIVGSYKALHIAIKNDKPVKRNSLVQDKLKALAVDRHKSDDKR